MKKNGILFIALIFAGMFSCSTKENLDATEYPILTTVTDLAKYYDLKFDTSGQHEQTSMTKYLDGSLELDYTYDLSETEDFDPMYYSITVSQENTAEEASTVYGMEQKVLETAGGVLGDGFIKIDTLQLPGDETYYAFSTYEGEPNGMLYSVRKGKYIYTLIISGVYTEDHSLITDLVLPKIEDLESLELKK